METVPQILAKWGVLFVTYAAGMVETEVGNEEVLAREKDIIAATLTMKKKLNLPDMEAFHTALQAAWKQATPEVQKAARALLKKIDAQAALADVAAPRKPQWKRM